MSTSALRNTQKPTLSLLYLDCPPPTTAISKAHTSFLSCFMSCWSTLENSTILPSLKYLFGRTANTDCGPEWIHFGIRRINIPTPHPRFPCELVLFLSSVCIINWLISCLLNSLWVEGQGFFLCLIHHTIAKKRFLGQLTERKADTYIFIYYIFIIYYINS